jgi:hypothetical protein
VQAIYVGMSTLGGQPITINGVNQLANVDPSQVLCQQSRCSVAARQGWCSVFSLSRSLIQALLLQVTIYVGPWPCQGTTNVVLNPGVPASDPGATWSISALTPPGVGSSLPITIGVPSGRSAASQSFTFSYAPPLIVAIVNTTGATLTNGGANGVPTVGGTVVLSGSSFGTPALGTASATILGKFVSGVVPVVSQTQSEIAIAMPPGIGVNITLLLQVWGAEESPPGCGSRHAVLPGIPPVSHTSSCRTLALGCRSDRSGPTQSLLAMWRPASSLLHLSVARRRVVRRSLSRVRRAHGLPGGMRARGLREHRANLSAYTFSRADQGGTGATRQRCLTSLSMALGAPLSLAAMHPIPLASRRYSARFLRGKVSICKRASSSANRGLS